jgi:hypothetical protein
MKSILYSLAERRMFGKNVRISTEQTYIVVGRLHMRKRTFRWVTVTDHINAEGALDIAAYR